MVSQWQEGGAYRTTFLALEENVAIRNMYLGITTLVSAELPIERMDVALGNANQEDEHSCFSDNTHRDIYLNLQGVIDVYLGNSTVLGSTNIASLKDLVQQADIETYNNTNASLALALSTVQAIQTPFDLAISSGISSTEGAKVRVAVLQLKDFGANLLAGATKIGITVN